jgi:aminoglycoside phosphotransferase family enzyme/predicted kinase
MSRQARSGERVRIVSGAAPIHESQRDVVAFLSTEAPYPPGAGFVRRIDTHGAHVFLGATDVFKIKRAVTYPYMDFSTLDKRRSACTREADLNAGNAPTIYRGLVAITREADGRLAIGGTGAPVEWAVRMVRFPEEDVLTNRVERQALDMVEAKALADAVVAAHARAGIVAEPPERSSMASIASGVLSALAGLFGAHDGDVRRLSALLPQRIEALRPHLARRTQDGHVRRCHGDLHLGNIVLIDTQPTLFDAIEFDEALATIDVLYDLAFLLMDLDHRGHRASANRVFNRYLWRRQEDADLEALAALPVYLALRAAIRAMVGAERAEFSGEGQAAAHAYLSRATRYLDDDRPRLVITAGLSGSGKSTLAAGLAPALGRAPGALHVRSDLERKALFQAGEFDRLPETAYCADVTSRVYDRLLKKSEAALRAGHSVIADAVFAEPRERAEIVEVARRTGAQLTAFWLDAPPDVLLQRVSARKNDASDATPQVVQRQMSYDLGVLEWTRLDASGTPEETLCTAMSYLHASIDPR